MTLRSRRPHLLHDLQNLAPSRRSVAPHPIEIGDQWRNLLGSGRRLRLSDIGEFIEGIMDGRVGAAPAPPAAARPENPNRPRQVIGRVPMIERCPVNRIGHFGAYYETALSHGSFLQKPAIGLCREKYWFQARIGKMPRARKSLPGQPGLTRGWGSGITFQEK